MSEATIGERVGDERGLWLLTAGYAVGLVGASWDDLEHADLTSLGAGFAHLLMYLGIILALVAVLLVSRSQAWGAATGRATLWRLLAAGGLVLLAAGFVVDVIWHGRNPDASETNMLALPGHVIQQLGLLFGLTGTGALVARSLLGQHGPR